MALLGNDQAQLVWTDGVCGKMGLYSLKNCTAADTVDVGNQFRIVKRGGIVSDTGTTIGSVTIAGTVLTIPAGPASDGVWLLVVGVAL